MKSISDCVFDTAARCPDSTAIHVEGRAWSYAELCKAAEAVASIVRQSGHAGPGHRIGLVSTRTFGSYACLLGVLAAGSAYVPLHLRWPPARMLEVCSHTGISRVLHAPASPAARDKLAEGFAGWHASEMDFGTGAPAYMLACDSAPAKEHYWDPAGPTASGEDSYAYLIFTSGSSGTPKGIPVTHRNVSACLRAAERLIPIASDDRVAQTSDLSFDVSVAEMFLCWRAGARLCVPSAAELMDPTKFILRNEITIWSSVPSRIRLVRALQALTDGAFPGIRLSVFCGEALPAA